MLLLLLVGSLLIGENKGQDFSFPTSDEDVAGKPPSRLTDNRSPISIPGRCPSNQLLYPGEQKHEWICDCGSGYIYYPPSDGCFRAYHRGPCKKNEYLVLPKNKVASECVPNPCQNDGFAQYNNECYELGKTGPCTQSVFGVNETTIQVECLEGPSTLSIFNFPDNCPPGSKRSSTRCRPEYR